MRFSAYARSVAVFAVAFSTASCSSNQGAVPSSGLRAASDDAITNVSSLPTPSPARAKVLYIGDPPPDPDPDPALPICTDSTCYQYVQYTPPQGAYSTQCLGRYPVCEALVRTWVDVAITNGKPNGKCAQTDGQDSLPIGATLGGVNDNGQQQTRSVVDVSQVNTVPGGSISIVDNSFVSYGYAPVGWIYIDNMGGRWFQGDPTATWPISFNVQLSSFFGFTVTPPSWHIPLYIKTGKAGVDNLVQSQDGQLTKCWSQGVNAG